MPRIANRAEAPGTAVPEIESRPRRPSPRLEPKSVHRFADDLFGDTMHARRVDSLSDGVSGVLHAASLAIHAIGRGLAAAKGIQAKHATKQMDRLLSNGHSARALVRAVGPVRSGRAKMPQAPTINRGWSFRGGEALHIMATGGAVPAFSGDLMFPKLLLIDEPAADSTGLIKAKTTEDLTLSFSRGVDGVTLMLTGSSNSTYLNCTSQASSNALTVKAAAPAALGSGAQLQLYTAGAVSLPVSGWSVMVGAVAEAATPDLKAPITVQIQ